MGQDLCKQCGLCCDGTLFATTPVDEATQHLFASNNQQPNGCEQLSSCGSCKIYENRPYGCRSFKCGVLKDLLKGHLKFKEAQQLIYEVKNNRTLESVVNTFRNWSKDRHSYSDETAKFHLPGMVSSEKNSDL